ncbi:MAG: carbon-nitrogen hydrolase [Gemmatimonadales bacterium]
MTTPSAPGSVMVGLVQSACSTDINLNTERALDGIRSAAAQGAQIVCLQELFRSRYFCQTEDHSHFQLAEPVPGPTTERLGHLARELEVVIVASLFERRAEGLYHNTAAILDADGTCLGRYRKMHIPDDPQFYEKVYFTPGDLGFPTWNTRYGRIGVLICWDQWYPEAARLTAMGGAQLLFYPTAIGWLPAEKAQYGASQYSAWETMQRSHAVANGVFVVAANRVGHEPSDAGGIEFWGGSFVADPYGNVLAKAGREPDVLVVPCDLAAVDQARTHWPFLRDRRIDAYQDLGRRFRD